MHTQAVKRGRTEGSPLPCSLDAKGLRRWLRVLVGAAVVLAFCWGGPIGAQTVAPTADELAVAQRWAAAKFAGVPAAPAEVRPGDMDAGPFFSFRYDGTPSAELLKTWDLTRSSRELDAQRTEHTLVYRDPRTGLVLRCVGVAYRDFPAVEWTLYFQNTGDHDTPILADIQAVDTSLRRASDGEFVLHGNKGDSCTPQNYEPYRHTLGPQVAQRFAPATGRPTNMDGWPYFNLQMPGGGMLMAIGWPGQWACSFTRDEGSMLRIAAGQERTHLVLHPGEQIRSPLIALLFWQGDDLERAQNLWRRWIVAHNLPRVQGQLPKPFVVGAGGMGDIGEAGFWQQIRSLEQSDIAWEFCWIDAGWYPCQKNWEKTGTWEIDRSIYPHGFLPLSQWLHAHGKKLLLWFELERVGDPNSWLAKNHPDWLLGTLLDLGNPAARQWCIDYVDQTISEQGVDVYRQDYNIEPLAHWQKHDAPERQGMTENLYVEGHLAFWDELRRRHPEIWIDCSASGGRRNDLETMRRALPLRRSDYEGDVVEHAVPMQAQTHALAAWFPFYGVFGRIQGDFQTRSCYSPSYGTWVPKDLATNAAARAEVTRAFGECSRVAPLMLADYYPLTPYSVADNDWIAWQFDRPETGEGVVQAFRRAQCKDAPLRVKLRGLSPDAVYTLTNFDVDGSTDVSGRELSESGLAIASPNCPGAVIVTYRKHE